MNFPYEEEQLIGADLEALRASQNVLQHRVREAKQELAEAYEELDGGFLEQATQQCQTDIQNLGVQYRQLDEEILNLSDEIEALSESGEWDRKTSGRIKGGSAKRNQLVAKLEEKQEELERQKSLLDYLRQMKARYDFVVTHHPAFLARSEETRKLLNELIIDATIEHKYAWKDELLDDLPFSVTDDERRILRRLDEPFFEIILEYSDDSVRFQRLAQLGRKHGLAALEIVLLVNSGTQVLQWLLSQDELGSQVFDILRWDLDDSEKRDQLAKLAFTEKHGEKPPNHLSGKKILYIAGANPAITRTIIDALVEAGADVTHKDANYMGDAIKYTDYVAVHTAANSNLGALRSVIPRNRRIFLAPGVRQSTVVDVVNSRIEVLGERD